MGFADRLKQIAVYLFLLAVIIAMAAALFPWRMSEERAYHTLEANGFKREDVTLKGIALIGCDGTKLRRKFTAVRDGRQYQGRICGTIFSGASVRID